MSHDELEGTLDLGGPSEPSADPVGLDRPLPCRPRRVIGRGGSGEVFEAWDPVLHRPVALKLLGLPTERARFLREARITAGLEHPHIVPVHGYGVTPEGTAWIAMALVEGVTLDAWVAQQAERRWTRAGLLDLLDIIERVCDALAYAHSQQVLHLDLKPTNVMVSDFGRVMLMDWGIARRVAGDAPGTDTLYGTPSFVAPEQVLRPDQVDCRTDVFGVGAMLYALLTGRAPHAGSSPRAILRAASQRPVPRPDGLDPSVPLALIDLVMDCLEREPADRPESISAVQQRLRALRRSPWSLPTRRVPAGSVIVRSGDIGDGAFVIASGRCQVRREGGTAVRTLGPGEVFGELALLTGARRSKTVVALDDVVLHVVSREALSAGLGLGSWAGSFARALAQRFSEIEARRESEEAP